MGLSRCVAVLMMVAVASAVRPAMGQDTTFAPDATAPNERPRDFTPFAQVETHRIRISNTVDGLVEVSDDQGKTWHQLGRVTAPATSSLMGYLASGYAPPGTIAATAVHGLRVRVGDTTTAYPKMVNILPREFAQTPNFFGGHVSGTSGIYTDIPTGTSIFRELSPYSGNAVMIQDAHGILEDLPTNYEPKLGDVLVILVQEPTNPLVEVDFQNVQHGKVTAKYRDGTRDVVTTVLKPVYGVGRYDGTSYTGVGAINTSHTGVLTISTAPVSMSPLLEGTGPERRGGFQIMPSYHNSQSDEAWAPSAMVLGVKGQERRPDQEGMPPLFLGHFNLAWLPGDMDHSWRVEVQYAGKQEWRPMPRVIGSQPNALRKVTAVRVVRSAYGDHAWIAERIAKDVTAYHNQQMALARDGKIPTVRGRVTVPAGPLDAQTQFVAFFIDGVCRSIGNAKPFRYDWDTTDIADGEHEVEVRDEDINNNILTTARSFVWVDNAGKLAVNTAAK
jgi:hypothetical protein